jgi:hypothetical protein
MFDPKTYDLHHLLKEWNWWPDEINLYYSAPDINEKSMLMSSDSCHINVLFLPHVHVV